MPSLLVWLYEDELLKLERLAQEVGFLDPPTAGELLEYFAHRILDGIERPGSWERGWLTQATSWDGGP